METLLPLQANLPSDTIIDSPTLEIAGTAVLEAYNRRLDGEPMPLQVEIAPPPESRSTQDHLALVACGVSMTLDLRNLQDEIACDEYSTSLLNAKALTGRPKKNLFTRYSSPGFSPRLVFYELKPLA